MRRKRVKEGLSVISHRMQTPPLLICSSEATLVCLRSIRCSRLLATRAHKQTDTEYGERSILLLQTENMPQTWPHVYEIRSQGLPYASPFDAPSENPRGRLHDPDFTVTHVSVTSRSYRPIYTYIATPRNELGRNTCLQDVAWCICRRPCVQHMALTSWYLANGRFPEWKAVPF